MLVTSISTITTFTIITFTEAKGIELKISRNISGDVELYQNTQCVFRLPIICMNNFLGTAESIKLKLSGRVEWDV